MAHNPGLLDALKAGDVELAVGRMAEPAMMRGVSFELLYAESLAVVTRPGHPLLTLAGGAASARDLLGYPLVLPEAGTAPRLHADGIFTAAGITVESGYTETQSSSVARSLTLLADAIWITPQHAVQPDLDHGWLSQLSVPLPAAAEPVGLLTRSAARPGELAGQLMQALRELALRRPRLYGNRHRRVPLGSVVASRWLLGEKAIIRMKARPGPGEATGSPRMSDGVWLRVSHSRAPWSAEHTAR